MDHQTPPFFFQEDMQTADGIIGPFASKVQNIFGAKGISINDRLLMVLLAACETLRMDHACVTQVKDKQLTVLCATSSEIFPLHVALRDIAKYTTGLVLARKSLVVLEKTAATPIEKPVDLTGQSPGRFLGVPILFDGAVWGTVELSGTAQNRRFTSDEIALADVLATVLAVPVALLT